MLAIALAGCGATGSGTTGSGADPAAAPVGPSPVAEPSAAPTASSSPAAPAPAQAPVPAPSDGPLTAPELPAVSAALGDEIALETGVVVEIVSVSPIEVTAQTPGEISGPALEVTVTARNHSAAPLAVDSAVVTVVADDGELGVGTTAGEPEPLAGTLEPGASATGTYIFMLDPAAGRGVTITVNYAAGEPLAVFTGETS